MAYTALAPSKQVRAVLVLLCAELCRGNVDARRAGGGRDRARARLVAHPRRSAVDGRCAAAARPARQSPRVRRGDRDPGGVRPAQPRLRRSSRARYDRAMAARMSAILSDAVGPSGLIGGQALDLRGDRPADQLRDARADPSRQDRRAVRGGRDVRRGDRRRRRRADRRARRRTRRTSASRSRSSTTCSTSPAIRRRPARRCAPTRARRRSCRSAASTARGSSPPSCARRRTARSSPFGAKRPPARAVGVRRGDAVVRASLSGSPLRDDPIVTSDNPESGSDRRIGVH